MLFSTGQYCIDLHCHPWTETVESESRRRKGGIWKGFPTLVADLIFIKVEWSTVLKNLLEICSSPSRPNFNQQNMSRSDKIIDVGVDRQFGNCWYQKTARRRGGISYNRHQKLSSSPHLIIPQQNNKQRHNPPHYLTVTALSQINSKSSAPNCFSSDIINTNQPAGKYKDKK